jgi:hypothetical protein
MENIMENVKQVSLRKASYLEKKIAEEAANMSVISTVDALVYSDYNEKLEEVSQDLRNYVAVRERIATARQGLRRIIKLANADKVDGILDSLSYEQRLLKIYSNLKGNLGKIPVEEVVENLRKRAEKVDEDSWRSPEISLSSLDSYEFLDGKIKKCKKAIMALEEELTEVNLSTKITLPTYVVEVAEELDLL